MIKRLAAFIVLSLVVVSCYKYKEPEKPKKLISKEDMANILIDLSLIRSVNGVNKKVLDSYYVEPSSYVYKKYNVDSLQFTLSNNYYAYYVEEYDEIYASVKDSLTVLKEEYKKLTDEKNKAKKTADSLKRAEEKAELEAKKETDEKSATIIKPVSDK